MFYEYHYPTVEWLKDKVPDNDYLKECIIELREVCKAQQKQIDTLQSQINHLSMYNTNLK